MHFVFPLSLNAISAMLKDKLGLSNPKSVLGSNGEEQLDDFAKLKERVKSHLATSDYQWIRPTMWHQVFGGSASGSRGNKRVHA